MKIIDAFWEKRNMGISCKEIELENYDTRESIKEQIILDDAQYVVVKIPAGNEDIMQILSESGYTFIECLFNVTSNLKNVVLNNLQKRLTDAVDYSLMNNHDVEDLYSEIRTGMFLTDRVNLDHYFTKEQGSNRYIGWISDEINRGSKVFKLLYKENTIGFFTLKYLGKGTYFPFLAGMYKNYIKSGLGINTVYKPICEVLNQNGTMISTYISSNNINAFHMHTALNFNFNKIFYVYVKHNC